MTDRYEENFTYIFITPSALDATATNQLKDS